MTALTEDATTPAPSLKRIAAWVTAHWRPYAVEVPILLTLTFVDAALVMLYPYLVKGVIDILGQELQPGQAMDRYGAILVQVLLLLGVGLSDFWMYSTIQTMRVRANLRFQFGVRQRAFEYLTRLGPRFFGKFRTGDVVTRLLDDVNEKLSWFMCSGIFRVFEALSTIVCGIAVMWYLNPTLMLYTAGPLPLLVGLFVFTAQHLHKRYDRVQKSISDFNDSLESCFSGIRVVKSFTAEESQRKTIADSIAAQRRAELEAVRWQSLIDSLYGNVWQLAIVLVLWVGGHRVISGEITVGDLVAFEAYVLMLVVPMFDLGQFLVRGKLSAVSIGRLEEIENAEPDVREPNEPQPLARRPNDPQPGDDPLGPTHASLSVAFADVSFRYTGAERDAVRNIRFSLPAGQTLALVGEVGSGKTSLLNLIPRLMEPTQGRILVGDRALTDWPLVELRQQLGYVSQEALLLSGTVRENLLFGRPWITDSELQQAIRVAQLEAEVARWPDGLETIVGSRGIRLSGGQKQRVALARALAGRPALLLLDDCTASLDAATEAEVWRGLREFLPECTTILVTHRPSTLQRVDQILVLDQGRLREAGSFAELQHVGTFFHELYLRWQNEALIAGDSAALVPGPLLSALPSDG